LQTVEILLHRLTASEGTKTNLIRETGLTRSPLLSGIRYGSSINEYNGALESYQQQAICNNNTQMTY